MLLALLFPLAHAFQCEGVAPRQMTNLIRNRTPISFNGVIRQHVGDRGCTGIRDNLMYFYFAPRKQVWFFECRAGQAWFDPDDNVGGVDCH